MILGVDEVGRGSWAGPLVVGAVVLSSNVISKGSPLEGLTDSKKLSPKKRQQFSDAIINHANGYGLGWVSSTEIDSIGLGAALKLATIRAVEQIKTPYHQIIIDGTVNFLKETAKGQHVTMLPKADLLIPAVSAASILAKVARDNYMVEQANLHPQYGFESNVGYGTARHLAAMQQNGLTPLHRFSFAPVANIAKGVRTVFKDASNSSTSEDSLNSSKITTTIIGGKAETAVAKYLNKNGYKVIARNWRTKLCEIDIVALDGNKVAYIEVKYRSSQTQGGGLEAITPAKLSQMKKAALLFRKRHPQLYLNCDEERLLVAAVNRSQQVELLALT